MLAKRELIGIQYLRGIAALMVVLYHISLQRLAHGNGTAAETLQSGVDIFFVISGVVMVFSTDGGRAIGAGEFIRRRLLRIAPLYWMLTLFMIVVLIVAPHIVQSSQLAWSHALASILFLPALNPATANSYIPLVTPGWTLNLEMFFYALFAIGMFLGRGRFKVLGACVAIPLVILAATNLLAPLQGTLAFYANPITLEFIYGMALGRLLLTREPRVSLGIGLTALVLLFVLLIVPPAGPMLLRPFRFGLFAFAIVAIAAAVHWPRTALLRALGNSSYSLYLSHFFVLSAFHQGWRRANLDTLPAADALFYLFATAFAVVGGYVCWKWIEMPMTKLAKTAPTGPSATVVAQVS